MSLRFAVLSSGSMGNTFFVRSGSTALLIDAGLPLKQVRERLKAIDEDIMDINGIAIGHAHSDHSKALGTYVDKYHLPVFCSAGTRDELAARPELKLPTVAENQREPDWRIIPDNGVVNVGELRIAGFEIPHDALQPCGFYIKNANTSLAVATDLGWVNEETAYWMSEADICLLEANHDVDLLLNGNYHPSLKGRVHKWHLSNEQAFEVIDVMRDDQQVLIGHISRGNNTIELVEKLRDDRKNILVVPSGMASPVITV